MTSKLTISESLFEDFCDRKRIEFHKISTGESPTPDYKVRISGHELIVEVKQIDMNPDEKEQNEKYLWGGMAQGGGTPGDRVWKKISDGNQQMAKLTRGASCPLCWHS